MQRLSGDMRAGTSTTTAITKGIESFLSFRKRELGAECKIRPGTFSLGGFCLHA
jgi:hypothetical protein